MSAPAWLRRPCHPSSPPDASSSAGRRPDTRRPASSSDSFDLPPPPAPLRAAALRPRRGLRPVLAAALLALPLLAALPTGAEAQTTQTFVSNLGQANGNAVNLSNDYAIAFTTGSNSEGYSLRSVEVRSGVISNLNTLHLTARIHTNSGGSPGSSLGTLTNPAFTNSNSDQTLTFTSTGIDLAANTTYFLVVDLSADHVQSAMRGTFSDNEDSGSLSGWSIGNDALHRTWNSTGAWGTSTTTVMKVSLGGVVKQPTFSIGMNNSISGNYSPPCP